MAGETYQAVTVSEGRKMDYTPTVAKGAGDVVMLVASGLIGVVQKPIAANELGVLLTTGVFDIAKVSDIIVVGDPIYWDIDGAAVGDAVVAGACTNVGVKDGFIGFALEADGAGTAEKIRVLWTGPRLLANTIDKALSFPIPDPGDLGTLTVTHSGICELTSTVGVDDVITLSDPPFPGCILVMSHAVRGGGTGIITMTCDNGVNTAGEKTIKFEHVGETITLIGARKSATANRWATMFADGATVSA